MARFRIVLEYDGSAYQGWQTQPGRPTIQEKVEGVLVTCLDRKVVVVPSGRTDSGVHACAQVAHFDVEGSLSPDQWQRAFNFHLPPDIRVSSCLRVSPEFHAQKSAVAKVYEYRILNRRHDSALDRRRWYIPTPIHWEAVAQALQRVEGTHDFRAFRGSGGATKTTVRTIFQAYLIHRGSGHYALRFRGQGFLKQMVRNLVGTVIEVGQGRRTSQQISELLLGADRKMAGMTAPSAGLFLVRVEYPDFVAEG